MSELKPCPFCGSDSVTLQSLGDHTRTGCVDCGAEVTRPMGLYRNAMIEWNTRPIEDALLKRLNVLDEKCPSDERHCGCVPILRDQLNKYQKALILITTMPELSQATTIAREALQERGKFIWTEQSVGEYWVTKLDILQDQYDALEKDYADVCQKRLEAADVFSRQIIELEAENAELEAAQRWIPVSERLPEERQNVLALDRTGTAYHWEYSRSLSNIFVSDYTHWMPLPEPPEVEK